MTTETQISRPAPFVEDIGKKLAEQSLALQNVPVVTTGVTGISQQPGETAAGFKARQDAARAFTTRQQAFADQQGLAQLVPQLQGTDIGRLGQLGAINQAQAQAILDAQREATRQAAFAPQEELDRFADITTGIMGGMRGTGTVTSMTPNPSPLQTALGIGSTLAGIYGGLTGRF